MADACLVRGRMTAEESEVAFEWGALLQLGDDLQDVREDLRRGSQTLFTRAAQRGEPRDAGPPAPGLLRNCFGAHGPAFPWLGRSERSAPDELALAHHRGRRGSHEFFSPAFLAQTSPAHRFASSFCAPAGRGLLTVRGCIRPSSICLSSDPLLLFSRRIRMQGAQRRVSRRSEAENLAHRFTESDC